MTKINTCICKKCLREDTEDIIRVFYQTIDDVEEAPVEFLLNVDNIWPIMEQMVAEYFVRQHNK